MDSTFKGILSSVKKKKKKKTHSMLGRGGDAHFQNQGLLLKTTSFPREMPC